MWFPSEPVLHGLQSDALSNYSALIWTSNFSLILSGNLQSKAASNNQSNHLYWGGELTVWPCLSEDHISCTPEGNVEHDSRGKPHLESPVKVGDGAYWSQTVLTLNMGWLSDWMLEGVQSSPWVQSSPNPSLWIGSVSVMAAQRVTCLCLFQVWIFGCVPIDKDPGFWGIIWNVLK